eukprot:829955-Pyramimonas_sp.AAC.1
MSVRREYEEIILDRGIVKGARAGGVFAVATSTDRTRWRLQQLGAATLFEAFYDAKKHNPENEQVLATERAGVQGVTLLLPNCKKCILEYYRDELNSMVGYGAKTSFIESMTRAGEAQKAWQKDCMDKRRARLAAQKTQGVQGGEAAAAAAEAEQRHRSQAGKDDEEW